jgi:putative transposase
MFFWARDKGWELHFIQPAKPTQNAFIESFNGKSRDQCLNQHWFRDIDDAWRILEACCRHYTEERPHRSLGPLPPAVFAGKQIDTMNFPH